MAQFSRDSSCLYHLYIAPFTKVGKITTDPWPHQTKAIMGDEIFPDEVMEIRVQMTKRYQEYLDPNHPKPNGKATGQLVGSCNLPHFTVSQLIQLFLGGGASVG